jgi:lipopolysaccharide/colanic/teichoic acid biosynthesis glycosyltransferase
MGTISSSKIGLAPAHEVASTRAEPTFPRTLREEVAQREQVALAENIFHSMLVLERRRAERSRKPFVLMLLDAMHENGSAASLLGKALDAITSTKRETDMVGWYKRGAILGVIFTEVSLSSPEESGPLTGVLRAKIEGALVKYLGREKAAKIAISLHVFPESWDQNHKEWVADRKLYPDLNQQNPQKKLPLMIKRVMDMVGSSILLLIISPILAAIAMAIKLTSKGPIIFRQERLGQFGARFSCLKFRTMFANNDAKIHQEYISQFIAGEVSANQDNVKNPVYKITNDPRVTTVGRFLRKTSLDELPQFWNVLRGEMSLVGPRPPVPYEFEIYDPWHRRKVLEVIPGMTGLWQVSGRSRTSFDDMVRLDLRYCQAWSLWLDIKILLATPGAIFSGDGAY